MFSSCSYSPNRTVVSKEKLSEYNPKHFNATSKKKSIANENDLIIQAIFYEKSGQYKKSNHFYSTLYDKTGRDEYMFRELITALYSGAKSKNISRLKEWTQKKPDDIQAKRLLISFYINEKKYDEAKVVGEELIEKSGRAIDFELTANPYILTSKYKKAVELLDKAYNKTYNEDILIKITTLLVNYIGDVDSGITYLEKHRKMHDCSEKICGQLIEIYAKMQKVNKLLNLYKELYIQTSKEMYAIKLVEGYIYTEDFDTAVDFLQKEYKNDELLYELYLAKKDYGSALSIANQLYFIQKNPKWLAESAMALFENAENKNDKVMLNRVVEKFEQALSKGAKDSVYLNYYGYTLIDKNIDVQKGIDIIKDALKEQPDNSYYLDSLAWGYYKLHRCKEAYKEMKKVVAIEGLKEEDIAQHWTAIQECNK